jgi:hypothetical protein
VVPELKEHRLQPVRTSLLVRWTCGRSRNLEIEDGERFVGGRFGNLDLEHRSQHEPTRLGFELTRTFVDCTNERSERISKMLPGFFEGSIQPFEPGAGSLSEPSSKLQACSSEPNASANPLLEVTEPPEALLKAVPSPCAEGAKLLLG